MLAIAVALALAASTTFGSQASASAIVASQVDSVIERTQTTRAPYALVNTNEIRRDDATIYEFSAEFNQGDLHRIETARDRIVANCRTGWTAHLNLASGEISQADDVSGAACGVETANIQSAAITGSKQSQYGLLQLLSITRTDGFRTYEVAPNGAIVGETITDQAGKLRLILKTISLSEQLPAGDLFSEASLARSVVPEDLKKKASDPSN